jgi:hypothetical protein
VAQHWLRSNADGIPPALEARLQRALHGPPAAGERRSEALAKRGATGPAVPEQLVAAGARVLAEVLRAPTMTRAHALDVLAADALVTCALEAAAVEPTGFRARAKDALTEIVRVAEDLP